MSVSRKLLTVILVLSVSPALMADEGMWTFDNPPTDTLRDTYGFEPDASWLEKVQLASVRLNDGGSGSFVSPEGLVLTNHHVAYGQLQKLSSSSVNYIETGFLAATRDEERRCPDLEINVLVSYEDVSARIAAAVDASQNGQRALEARQAVIALIEKESLEQTGLRSDVVKLYHGGEYWLYRYQRYTDVRLVFAPEADAAYFGGDDDNFTFPRFDLDMALFRVYQDDRPIDSPAYLKLNPDGAREGDLVFVSGHPGSTDRLETMAQLAAQRDFIYPQRKMMLDLMLGSLEEYSTRGPEQARQAGMMLMGLNNSLKAGSGEFEGLKEPAIWQRKAAEEKDFRDRVKADKALSKRYGKAWKMLEKAEEARMDRAQELMYRRMPGFRLGKMAQMLVRYVQETAKPDGERLDGYHDSELRSLKFRLFSPAPIHPEMEEFMMARFLGYFLEALGEDDEFMKLALDGKTPEARAAQLVSGTGLLAPARRKEIADGGAQGLRTCGDPMIELALALEPILRGQHDWVEEKVTSVAVTAGEMLGAARFAVYGKSIYPDATFTLRLSYGVVKGYPMNGTRAPSRTTLYGLFDRAESFGGEPPFNPPRRFYDRLDALDLSTPINFVSTCDITGGNSGSPVIDREGRLVGLIFDGNIESLVGRYVYDDTAGRSVSVHAAAIAMTLRDLYDAGDLLSEMMN